MPTSKDPAPQGGQATPAAPAEPQRQAKPAPAEPEFHDTTPVTVLYGYGKAAPHARVWLGAHDGTSYEFKGGVSINPIPYAVARVWKEQGQPVHILPRTATEADYIRVAGITPLAPDRLAAQLANTDHEQLFAALGPKAAEELARYLAERLSRGV